MCLERWRPHPVNNFCLSVPAMQSRYPTSTACQTSYTSSMTPQTVLGKIQAAFIEEEKQGPIAIMTSIANHRPPFNAPLISGPGSVISLYVIGGYRLHLHLGAFPSPDDEFLFIQERQEPLGDDEIMTEMDVFICIGGVRCNPLRGCPRFPSTAVPSLKTPGRSGSLIGVWASVMSTCHNALLQ